MTKKLLSILLVVCMMASLFAGVAWAAEGDNHSVAYATVTGGSATGPATIKEGSGDGTSITVTLTPESGYEIAGCATTSGTATPLTGGEYTVTGVTADCTITPSFNALAVLSIDITKKPDKLSYLVGESLNTNGMEVTVKYADNSTKTITAGFTTTPASGYAFLTGDNLRKPSW